MLHVPEVQWTVVGALELLEHLLPQIPYSLSFISTGTQVVWQFVVSASSIYFTCGEMTNCVFPASFGTDQPLDAQVTCFEYRSAPCTTSTAILGWVAPSKSLGCN